MFTGINRDSEQTLASILSNGQLLAPGEALELLREIVRQVVVLHSSGQLHLGITLDTISTGPDGIELKPAAGTASLESLRELLSWSPADWLRLPRALPTNLVAARQMLATARIATDPCMFDLFAIGDVFCRVLTGDSSAAYRQSVRVKGLVPVEFRTVLERLLGADGQSSFESAQLLWDFLQEHSRDGSDLHHALSGRTEDFEPAPTPTGHNSITGIPLNQADNNGTAPRQIDRSVPAQGIEDLPFQKLGHFEIQARIGHGGMGDVYRAYERSLDRTVAIKVLPAEFARQTDFVRRFQAEASSVAKLVHPNIIQIYFIGIDSGHHFFAMQYIDGFSLAVLLNEKKKLPVNTAVSLVEQILLGLQEAHALGFVHRDVKPGNILIDRVRQRALLADFGLVKLAEGSQAGMTATGVILGTVDYLSPEQALGKDVDARSDLYSIGVLLYHILSGQLPFSADTPTALIFQHVYEQPRPLTEVAPHVAKPLATIVNKLIQKIPADRYQSARDVLTDLAAFRNEQPLVIASQSGSDCNDDVFRSAEISASVIEKLILPTSLAEDAESAAETTGWERWLTRWRAKFQQHAPQRLLELQNTQQQVQGGLAVYETRRENLEKLVREAQDIRDELARAAAQSRGTSDAMSLEQQLAAQDEQLDDLKLKLAKTSSTLQRLLSQRDLLNARLKAAGAQLKSDGQFTSRRFPHRKLILVAATAALVVVAILIAGRLVRQSSLASPAPAFPTGPPLAESPSDVVPQPVATASAAPTVSGRTPEWRKWPVTNRDHVVIPLDSAIKAMDVQVGDYVGEPNYMLYVSLENDTVSRFGFRATLDHVTEAGFYAYPTNVHAVAISPSETYVAFAAGDKSIRVFKAKSMGKEEYRRLDGHALPANSLLFSSDESVLVSASDDQTIRFWNVQSATEDRRLEIPMVPRPLLAANRTLSRFVLGGRHDGGKLPARVWNAVEGRQESAFPLDDPTSAVAISDDSETAFCFSSGRFFAWNALNGEKLREFGMQGLAGAIAAGSGRAITLSENMVRLWNIHTGELIETLSLEIQPRRDTKMLLAENGEMAVIATRDKQLHILYLPKAPPAEGLVHSFTAATPIHSLDISYDGIWAAGGGEGEIFLWNLMHPQSSYTLDSPALISAVQFSPQGDYLAYGTGEQNSKIHQVGVRELMDDHVQRFMNRKQDWRQLPGFERRITSLAWDKSGDYLIASSDDGSIRVWEPRNDQVVTSLQLPDPIRRFANVPDESLAVFVRESGTIESWRWNDAAATERSVFTVSDAMDIAASSAGADLIAFATTSGQISVVQRKSGETIATLETARDPVTGFAFAPESRILASGHQSGIVRLWDVDRSQEIQRFSKEFTPISAIEVTPDGRYVVAASLSGTVNVWQIP